MKDVINYIHNMYKENVPASMRMAVKSLTNPTPVTENNFTKQELALMKQLYKISMDRASTPQAKQAQRDMQNIKKNPDGSLVKFPYSGVTTKENALQFLQENFSPTLQYKDYPKQGLMDSKHPIISSFTSPSYSIANTIGRALYEKDIKGNTHIKDTYDMPKIDPEHMQNFKNNTSPDFQLLHEIINRRGNTMPVDINLRDSMEKN